MVVTPFTVDGKVATDEIAAVVAHSSTAGVPGVSALGLGGEATGAHARRAVAVAAEVLAAAGPDARSSGAAPTTPSSHASSRCSRRARSGGDHARGPPRSSVGSTRSRVHYEAVASAIAPVPMIVQDAPAFLGVTLGRAFIERLMGRATTSVTPSPRAFPPSTSSRSSRGSRASASSGVTAACTFPTSSLRAPSARFRAARPRRASRRSSSAGCAATTRARARCTRGCFPCS